MPREKSHHRDRHSSSNSDSSYERKKYKSKHKRRSRSKDRSESSSHRRKRSTSYSRHRKRSYSRSSSRERYESKSRSKKSNRHSVSRERDSRSSSKSKIRYNKSKYKSHRTRSSDRSSSNETEHSVMLKKTHMDDIESKVEKAIKAAEAVGLTMTKLPTYEYKEIEIKEDMPTIHDRNLLDELNSDSFTQKSFTSSRTKKFSQNIVIDLDSQTVRVPEIEAHVPKDDSIINFDKLASEEELREIWVKKLYNYRKKMLKGEL
ncbi:hypothetical protein EVAR_37012_1 [Eumeta japonica]|uniref:Serine/Arginine-related protein 53 n=1 Tax=Eumeta variegata TaxID=151549 RepID=A0A4C1WZ01_EUMVA|nr:hypothetical protein EVAR_37012_1 [Eumeta japonica]